MPHPMVSCTGIHKQFEQYVFPSKMLQDHILRFRTHKRRWSVNVLNDISLSVEQGEWLGLYGPNGSGKTTLLKILGGLLPADAGSVSIEGKLACFFELGVGFHPERSASENIYLHGLMHGMDANTIERHTDDIIERAGVASHRDVPIKCYSTGMRMRLAFITIMRTDADVYFLDEILAVGDAGFKEICKEEFRVLKEKKKTIVLVHHGLNELQKNCDRILFIEAGKIVREERGPWKASL